MNKNLLLRALTGIVILAVVINAIVWSPFSFVALFAILSVLTVAEFCTLTNQTEGFAVNRTACMLGAFILFLSLAHSAIYRQVEGVMVYACVPLYLIISELYRRKSTPIANIGMALMSQFYVALPFALLNYLAFPKSGDISVSHYQYLMVLSVFIFLWSSDTGAYCFGTLFGRHRLFERISPKKSWEGSIGGLFTCLVAAYILWCCNPEVLTLGKWLGLAMTVVVFGTWGDLTESLIKRSMKIKDSGTILPGHGGFWDRFDSALLAIPAALLYLSLI